MPAFAVSAAAAAGLVLLAIRSAAVAGTGTLEKRQIQIAPAYGDEVRKEDREREQAEQFLVMSRRGLETHERFLRSIEQEVRFWKNNLTGDASEELKAYSKTMVRDAEATSRRGGNSTIKSGRAKTSSRLISRGVFT